MLMLRYTPFILLVALTLLHDGMAGKEDMNDDSLIRRKLLNDNEENQLNSRPLEDTGKPVKVRCTMYLLDISEIDSKNMEFVAQFYFRQKWEDPRLLERYQETGTKPGETLNVNDLKRIWKPDLFIVEARQGRLHTVTVPNTFLKVFPNGTAFQSMRLSIKLRCDMDLRTYPHDTQKCKFSIESYRYTADELLLNWEEQFISNGEYVLPEFSFQAVNFSSETVSLGAANYGRLVVELTLKRKIGYFMTKVYVPYILLVLVSCLSFWISPKLMPLRLSLLLSALLIMLLLSSDMSNYIPPASYTKAIDVWTGFCLTFVFVAFLEYVFVCQIMKQWKKDASITGKVDQEMGICTEDLKEKKRDNIGVGETVSTSQFVAHNLSRVRQWTFQADMQFRYIYPVLFAVFNLIYWCSYAS